MRKTSFSKYSVNLYCATHQRITRFSSNNQSKDSRKRPPSCEAWSKRASAAWRPSDRRERGTDEKLANIGMEIDNPPPDFATIAKGMGCYGEGPIFNGDQVGPALKRAIEFIKKEGKPALVDTVTQFR